LRPTGSASCGRILFSPPPDVPMALHALLIAAAFTQPNPNFEFGVAASYVRGGSFDGPGFVVQSLWSPKEYFAVGAMLDVARVSALLVDGAGLRGSIWPCRVRRSAALRAQQHVGIPVVTRDRPSR